MAKKRKAKRKKKKHLASLNQGMLISVFDDLGQAHRAMDDLLRAGISPNQVWYTMRGGGASMLNSLELLGIPDQEVDFYHRELEAGHTVVMVQTADREQETSSVTFWGWLFALGMLLTRGKRAWQKALATTPALFVVLSGPARVYLGVHWASDALGAYLFGGSWLGLSLRLYRALKKRKVLDG